MSHSSVPSPPDLSSCDREPIRIPGSIQPHGALLVVEEPEFRIVQASANAAEFLGAHSASLIGQKLTDIIGPSLADALRSSLDSGYLENNPQSFSRVRISSDGRERYAYAIGHRYQGVLIVEFEEDGRDQDQTLNSYAPVQQFLSLITAVKDRRELAHLAAIAVRQLTGFDRVLIYEFDPDWNGQVIAEDGNGTLPSYLDLRFPASDIPQQARELYRINRLRLIADANYRPVRVLPADNPLTGKPLDLTFATLRSVSPVHLEYMRNMGTMSSMSISLLREERLWGLISCHHREPKIVPFWIRAACDVLGQVVSLQLASLDRTAEDRYRVSVQAAQSNLLARMAEADRFVEGLLQSPEELLGFADAQGGAVLFEDQCKLIGVTPDEDQVRAIVKWLSQGGVRTVFHSDCLSNLYSPAHAYSEQASGLLAISISEVHRSYVLWFRPEVIRTVAWGGDPHKPAEPEPGSMRIHPRKSFEAWKETVRLRSRPWRSAEVEAAEALRNAIVRIVLKKAEELGQLNAELERSNRELEAFSYSVSHDLRAPFRHIVGYSELLRGDETSQLSEKAKRYADTVIESAHYAGTLVDNLLQFSQVGRAALHVVKVSMNGLVRSVAAEVKATAPDRDIEMRISPLEDVHADHFMLRLVVRNLLENAVKYTRGQVKAIVEVGNIPNDRETIVFIRDNGVGFDMQYSEKLFGVFQRLHKMEDYEGTGIGLANVRRIISRHGGRTWAEGSPNAGATFYFSLPRKDHSEVA